MTDEHRFCVHCGAQLPECSRFCPDCGASVDDQVEYSRSCRKNIIGGRSTVPIFILVYGIIGTLIGASMLFDSVIIDASAYQSLIDDINSTFIEGGLEPVSILPEWSDSTKIIMILSALFGTLSPLAALGCYYFCYRQGPKQIAMYLCIASTVLILGVCCFTIYALMAIPSFIIGALITYMLYNSKDVFAE